MSLALVSLLGTLAAVILATRTLSAGRSAFVLIVSVVGWLLMWRAGWF